MVLGLVTDRLTGSEMSLGRSLKGPSVMKKSNKSAAVAPVPSTIINQPSTSADRPSLPPIDFARRRVNRSLSTERVIELLRLEVPGFFNMAEVVGKWVWIQFREKQPSKVTAVLAELGFHWNNKRQVWQHPCGTVTPVGFTDPRQRYHCYFPADLKAA